jgi:hypothetical protein
MKVRISFTVDIDPDAWLLEYGDSGIGVRADVQTYVAQSVLADFADRGLSI